MKNQPAFPHSHLGISRGELSHEDSDYEDGMTLLDYFAGQAIAGILAAKWYSPSFDGSTELKLARQAYALARAVMEVKNEQK